jgi:hypothetical protein
MKSSEDVQNASKNFGAEVLINFSSNLNSVKKRLRSPTQNFVPLKFEELLAEKQRLSFI